jgi:hypothetical protein
VHIDKWIAVFLGVGVAVGFAACGDDGDRTASGVTNGVGAGTTGLGVGDPCKGDDDCRPGLACEPSGTETTCQPAGTLAEGDDCVISAECGEDLYCNEGECAAAGTGGEGDACTELGDCQKGFTCDDVSDTCTEIGDETGLGDVGDDCMASSDCYSPLECGTSGTCEEPGGGGSGGNGMGGNGGGGNGQGGGAGGSGDICVNDGNCNFRDDDCVCADCDTDPFCSDPTNCNNDSTCQTFEEGCVCADCASHPECLN